MLILDFPFFFSDFFSLPHVHFIVASPYCGRMYFTSVRFCTKQGQAVNELTKYRYDVVLATGHAATATAAEDEETRVQVIDYTTVVAQTGNTRPPASSTLSTLIQHGFALTNEGRNTTHQIQVTSIPNPRLRYDRCLLESIDAADDLTIGAWVLGAETKSNPTTNGNHNVLQSWNIHQDDSPTF